MNYTTLPETNSNKKPWKLIIGRWFRLPFGVSGLNLTSEMAVSFRECCNDPPLWSANIHPKDPPTRNDRNSPHQINPFCSISLEYLPAFTINLYKITLYAAKWRYHSKYSPYIAASGNDNQIVPIRPRSCPARVHKILCGAIRVVAPNELAAAGKVLSFPTIRCAARSFRRVFGTSVVLNGDGPQRILMGTFQSMKWCFNKLKANFKTMWVGLQTILMSSFCLGFTSWEGGNTQVSPCEHSDIRSWFQIFFCYTQILGKLQDPISIFIVLNWVGEKNKGHQTRQNGNEAAMACAESAVEGSAKIGRPTHSLGGKMITWANPTSSCRKKCPDHPMDVFQLKCSFLVCWRFSSLGEGFQAFNKNQHDMLSWWKTDRAQSSPLTEKKSC